MTRLKRFVNWLRWQRAYEASLNRRVEVEAQLFDAASGKAPLPTAQQCRAWAVKLGVPFRP